MISDIIYYFFYCFALIFVSVEINMGCKWVDENFIEIK